MRDGAIQIQMRQPIRHRQISCRRTAWPERAARAALQDARPTPLPENPCTRGPLPHCRTSRHQGVEAEGLFSRSGIARRMDFARAHGGELLSLERSPRKECIPEYGPRQRLRRFRVYKLPAVALRHRDYKREISAVFAWGRTLERSEEHTSELQSPMY